MSREVFVTKIANVEEMMELIRPRQLKTPLELRTELHGPDETLLEDQDTLERGCGSCNQQ